MRDTRRKPRVGREITADSGLSVQSEGVLLKLVASEEVGQLDGGVLFAIATVGAVAAHALGEGLADRTFRRVGGVGCAHDFTPLGNGVFTLEAEQHAGAFAHEFDELAEEGTVLVNGVEAFGLLAREVAHAHGTDLEASGLSEGEDRADLIVSNGVGFENCECLFHNYFLISVSLLRA